MEGTEGEIVSGPNGRYVLEESIGRGGVGEVFCAHDTQLHRRVAVKRLYSVDGETPAGKVMQEARHLAALQHPNIVTVYDYIEDHGDLLVVMELLQGRTLQEIAEKAPLTEEDFIKFMEDVLEGLIAAHDIGMLHRDIKPSNLMFVSMPSGAFRVKILDFGLAKIAEEPSMQTIDVSGGVLGSVFTMSPEQFEGKPLDARTDLYSLGCVSYFALTTYFPFTGASVPEVITAHMRNTPVPLETLRPDLPLYISRWVEKLMSVSPEARPASAAAALEALRTPQAQSAARPKTSKVPVPMTTIEPKRRGGLIVAGVTLVLALIGVVLAQPKAGAKAEEKPAAEVVAATAGKPDVVPAQAQVSP